MQTAPAIPFPKPAPEAPPAHPTASAAAGLPLWAVGILSGCVVATIAAAIVSILLWQQSTAAQARVVLIQSEVAGLSERLSNTIATANDNTAQQRKAIEAALTGIAALTKSTNETAAQEQRVIESMQSGLASLRQSNVATAQDNVTQRESLRTMDQRFLQLQDLVTTGAATITTLATGSRNLQRMLKEHDDAIREMLDAPPRPLSVQTMPVQTATVSAKPPLAANPVGSPPTIMIEGGKVNRSLPATKAAAKIPVGTDILAQPLPDTSALLFGGGK